MKKTIARAAAVVALSSLALAGCGLTDEEKPVAAPTIEAEEEAAAGFFKPVNVHVIQRQAALLVFTDNRECWTLNVAVPDHLL